MCTTAGTVRPFPAANRYVDSKPTVHLGMRRRYPREECRLPSCRNACRGWCVDGVLRCIHGRGAEGDTWRVSGARAATAEPRTTTVSKSPSRASGSGYATLRAHSCWSRCRVAHGGTLSLRSRRLLCRFRAAWRRTGRLEAAGARPSGSASMRAMHPASGRLLRALSGLKARCGTGSEREPAGHSRCGGPLHRALDTGPLSRIAGGNNICSGQGTVLRPCEPRPTTAQMLNGRICRPDRMTSVGAGRSAPADRTGGQPCVSPSAPSRVGPTLLYWNPEGTPARGEG